MLPLRAAIAEAQAMPEKLRKACAEYEHNENIYAVAHQFNTGVTLLLHSVGVMRRASKALAPSSHEDETWRCSHCPWRAHGRPCTFPEGACPRIKEKEVEL